MRSPSYWWSFIKAFFLRFRVLILLGLIFGVGIFLISNVVIPRLYMEGSIRIGLTGRYSPDSLPYFIIDDVSDGLTKLSPDGVVEPSIASSWETPDKGKTWIFHIDDKASWQNGDKIESSEINYQFSDVEIERPDDKIIIFKLKDPFSPFPSVVSRPVFKSGFLGTGDWKVTDVSLAGSFIQSLTIQKSGESKKIFKFYPTEERTKSAFKLGHVDEIDDIIDPSPLNNWSTVNVEKDIKRNEIVTLFYNNEDELFKDNKELRQALNYAIDKDKFDGERAISPIPPFNWVYNPQVKPYTYNQDRARELLKDIKLKEGTQIKLVTSPILLTVAESIAKDWQEVGIKAIIQISSVIPTDFQGYLTILDIPKDPDQYSIWHSTQKDSTNISRFVSPRIDKLLEDGRIELNTEARRQIYLDFQRFIVEEMPASFLYHPVSYNIIRK